MCPRMQSVGENMEGLLLFQLLQCVELFGHLVDRVLLLLAQSRYLSLVLSVRLVQVTSQLL